MVEVTEAKVLISGGNDWKIVGGKFLKGLVFSFAGIGIPYSIEFLQNEDLSGLPIWFIAFVPFIIAALTATQNAIAHRQKITLVTNEVTGTKIT
jgi:hypothetical protein